MDYNTNRIITELMSRASAEHEVFLDKCKTERVPESEYLEHLGWMNGVLYAASIITKHRDGDI